MRQALAAAAPKAVAVAAAVGDDASLILECLISVVN